MEEMMVSFVVTMSCFSRITIPKVEGDATHVVVTVKGPKENHKTAQYLMQKVLKS